MNVIKDNVNIKAELDESSMEKVIETNSEENIEIQINKENKIDEPFFRIRLVNPLGKQYECPNCKQINCDNCEL